MAKVAAVVPAAGCGKRMGAGIRKQYLALGGLPILGHTLRVLETSSLVQDIVLVAGEGEADYCRRLAVDELGLKKVTAIVTGGQERQDSVFCGLLALAPDTEVVLIHDAVRPFLSDDNLKQVIRAALHYGAATCAVPVKDTVKLAGEDEFVSETLPRNRLWLTQTPQAFLYHLILEAHQRAREVNYQATDDAALLEKLGQPVKLVEGSYRNIKITTPEDLIIAAAMLDNGQ
ncbi:MAG: 2-C-methyl-D-erythritol 4-phosphate cytidylyltransferase [Pelotomaculum sp.]